MYVIRPAASADRDEVADMIRSRAEWMREHGQGRWVSWLRSADTLAEQIDEPDWPVWVLTTLDGDIAGCTTATNDTPHLGWTEQDQAEPAVFLQSTVTHPRLAGEGVGILIAFWALDLAARRGAMWVRRGVLTDETRANHGLIRYYRQQGWRVVHSVRHPRKPGITVWSLARRAEHQTLTSILVERNRCCPLGCGST